jgi:hypothetical protein
MTMRFGTTMWLLVPAGLFELGCLCNSIPNLTECDDPILCIGRRDETQLTCQCALDADGKAQYVGIVDQIFNMQVCLPPSLNIATADAGQLAAIEAMTSQEYTDAVSAYCQNDVAAMMQALIGVMTGSSDQACDHITAVCVATPANDGKATSVNETCNLPCDTTTCNALTCPACEVNPGCYDGTLSDVHPEQCKCTDAEGCGVAAPNVCVAPTWAPDPPTIAVGMMALQLSQPTEIVVDHAQSQLELSASVEPGFPCGSDTDTASPHVSGKVMLFGTPCPGGECDMLMDIQLAVDNFSLHFDISWCPDGDVDVSAWSISAGGEHATVHLGPDGCGTIGPGDLRVSAGAILDLDGDVERKKYDSTNSEPLMFCVDFVNNTFRMEDATISLVDGSASLDLIGNITNQPPFADAGPDQTVECDQELAAAVALDGSASSDPDGAGDIPTYVWWRGEPLDPSALSGYGAAHDVVAPLGTTDYHLTVSDQRFVTMASRVGITVEDTTDPTIGFELIPAELWPPNHKLVEFNVEVEAQDICDPNPVWVLSSITSDEPDNDTGDGNTNDDIQGADIGTPDTNFFLRAERKGNGEGRVYTVTYTVTDSSGNDSSVSVDVSVPHDQGH